MSAVRGFGLNGKSIYRNVCKPMEVDCNFIVDSTNGNGLGIRSLKSNGFVESVFMHTTQTPGVINGVTNPNPAAGYAQITFKNNFNYYLGGFSGQIVPTTSNSTTATTAGSVYVITALGTATLAQWQAKGLPPGLTPTVGQAFVATATGTIGGSAHVGIPGVPLVSYVSVIGDPNTEIANSNIAQNAGAKIIVQFSSLTASGTISGATLTMNSYTPAGTNDGGTPPIFTGTPAVLTGTISAQTFTNTSVYTVASPADGTVVAMQFMFDGSSVTIDGL